MATGQLTLALTESLPAGDRRTSGRRPRRRGHVHLGAAAGAALVRAEAGPAADPVDRHLRPTRPGALGRSLPGAADRRRLDDGVRVGGRAWRAVDRADAGAGQGHPQRAGRRDPTAMSVRATLASVKTVWLRPGTRLGFFTHMGTQFSVTVFALMWGVPYLTVAQGLSADVAGSLLTRVGRRRHLVRHRDRHLHRAAAASPVALRAGHHREQRRDVDGRARTARPAPLWLLALLVVVISVGGPGSMVGFDFARTFNPSATLGTAQGMVNMGGFIASLLVMQAMGVDHRRGGRVLVRLVPAGVDGSVRDLGARGDRHPDHPQEDAQADVGRTRPAGRLRTSPRTGSGGEMKEPPKSRRQCSSTFCRTAAAFSTRPLGYSPSRDCGRSHRRATSTASTLG